MPAAKEGVAVALCLQVAVVIVEIFASVRDAHHTGRQVSLLARVGHRFGI